MQLKKYLMIFSLVTLGVILPRSVYSNDVSGFEPQDKEVSAHKTSKANISKIFKFTSLAALSLAGGYTLGNVSGVEAAELMNTDSGAADNVALRGSQIIREDASHRSLGDNKRYRYNKLFGSKGGKSSFGKSGKQKSSKSSKTSSGKSNKQSHSKSSWKSSGKSKKPSSQPSTGPSGKSGKQEESPCPSCLQEADSLSLPQYDPNSEQRANALLAIQDKIDNARRFHSYNGLEENALEIARGPLLAPDSYALGLAYTEAQDIDARTEPEIDFKIGGLIIGKQVPVETMEDLENMYQAFQSFLPVPKGLKNWKDDSAFGDLRRTFLGHKLVKIDQPLFDLDLNAKELGELFHDDLGFEDCDMYGIDLMDVTQYNADDGRPNYVPGAQAMFMLDNEGQLLPIAIKLSNGLVYTHLDSENEWLLAKMALSVAETVWTSAHHFTSTHLVVEPIRVELMRHVSTSHPVNALLSHHMKNLFGNSLAGLVRLFTNGTALDLVSGWGAKGYTEYFSQQSLLGSDFNRTFANEMMDRGLNDLPNYRQGDDRRESLAVVRDFVYNYLKNYYCDDQLVQDDNELQDWARATASNADNDANIINFPESFDSLDELTDTVTHIIYLLTIKHHSMNAGALWHGSPLPGASLAFWAPLPASKNVEVDLRSFLPPGEQLITGHVALFEAFLRYLHKDDSLLYSYVWTELGKKSDSEIRKFQQDLLKVQKNILEREENHDGISYDILTGENLPYFVWI